MRYIKTENYINPPPEKKVKIEIITEANLVIVEKEDVKKNQVVAHNESND